MPEEMRVVSFARNRQLQIITNTNILNRKVPADKVGIQRKPEKMSDGGWKNNPDSRKTDSNAQKRISKVGKTSLASVKTTEKLAFYERNKAIWLKKVAIWRRQNSHKADYSENHQEEQKFQQLLSRVNKKILILRREVEKWNRPRSAESGKVPREGPEELLRNAEVTILDSF